jgi:hemerythrin-like domain-containing protein
MSADGSTTQIRLPGQAHVAKGPHDQTGMYLMHHAFRRDLIAFESAVRRTPAREVETWRALAARWGRFAEVLHHHHAVEDASIWPLLLSEIHDDADRAVLRDMQAEHGQVDPALAATTDAFAAMTEDPNEERRAALEAQVAAVRELLHEHLAHEEREALPLLQRTLSAEQFAATEKAAEKGYPVRLLPFLVPWVMEGVPDQVARSFLREAGRVYSVLLTVTRPRFHRAERRAFRHAV